jgi:hypothetical protein
LPGIILGSRFGKIATTKNQSQMNRFIDPTTSIAPAPIARIIIASIIGDA